MRYTACAFYCSGFASSRPNTTLLISDKEISLADWLHTRDVSLSCCSKCHARVAFGTVGLYSPVESSTDCTVQYSSSPNRS